MVNNPNNSSTNQPSTSQSNQEQTNKIVQKKNMEETTHENDVPKEKNPQIDVPNKIKETKK